MAIISNLMKKCHRPDPIALWDMVGLRRCYVRLQTFTSGPTSEFRTLLQAWNRVSMRPRAIYIETPYFLPTDSLHKALIGAALSGVEVFGIAE